MVILARPFESGEPGRDIGGGHGNTKIVRILPAIHRRLSLDIVEILLYIHPVEIRSKRRTKVDLVCREKEASKPSWRISAILAYRDLLWGGLAMAEDVRRLFAGVREFGWDSKKREINLRTHGIDFEDACGILDGPTIIRRSDRHDEVRYQIFGYVQGREVAVVCTIRGAVCWLISARRSRRDERRKFYDRFKGLPEEGQD
jgi:uncharacterized DUF497 family protein